MKIIHVSGIKIQTLIENNPIFQGLKWSREKFPNMSNINIIENDAGTAGIICDNDSFGGQVSWAYYKGKNPVAGKTRTSIESDEEKFLRENFPELLTAIRNLDA